jgi:hypothetical protein
MPGFLFSCIKGERITKIFFKHSVDPGKSNLNAAAKLLLSFVAPLFHFGGKEQEAIAARVQSC